MGFGYKSACLKAFLGLYAPTWVLHDWYAVCECNMLVRGNKLCETDITAIGIINLENMLRRSIF
jgi:hypothetical protein